MLNISTDCIIYFNFTCNSENSHHGDMHIDQDNITSYFSIPGLNRHTFDKVSIMPIGLALSFDIKPTCQLTLAKAMHYKLTVFS